MVSKTASQKDDKTGGGGLRLKDGPYLTRKVERIILQVARGRPTSWIAKLYDVHEPFVYYVARKLGFSVSELRFDSHSMSRKELEKASPNIDD